MLTSPDNPIPRPVPNEDLVCDGSKSYSSQDTCYPLDTRADQSWSLNEVFGRVIKGSCPLTKEAGEDAEIVCLEVPRERDVYTTVGEAEYKQEDGDSRCWKIPSKSPKSLNQSR